MQTFYRKTNDKVGVDNALLFCLKLMNRCKYKSKTGSIWYNYDRKLGTYYPDLYPGEEFWYLVPAINHYCK